MKGKDPEFVAGCRSEDANIKCQICSRDDERVCNNQNLAMETCIECNSNEDPRCRDDPESTKEKFCSVNAKTSGCYLHRYEDVFKRGCIADLSESVQKLCWNQSDKCKSCFGKNCNAIKDYKTCYICNSRGDPHCIEVSELTNVSICTNYLSSCAIAIENGHTHRKCYEDINSTNEIVQTTMHICSDDKCNGNLFPENRLQCYQCNGDEECKNITENTRMGPCTIYSENDQCYSLLNEGNILKQLQISSGKIFNLNDVL